MSPNTPYIDKLRISRIVLQDKIDGCTIEFDKECLEIIREVVEEAIQRLEFIEKIKGGKTHE